MEKGNIKRRHMKKIELYQIHGEKTNIIQKKTNRKKRLYRKEVLQGENYLEKKYIQKRDIEQKRLYLLSIVI